MESEQRRICALCVRDDHSRHDLRGCAIVTGPAGQVGRCQCGAKAAVPIYYDLTPAQEPDDGQPDTVSLQRQLDTYKSLHDHGVTLLDRQPKTNNILDAVMSRYWALLRALGVEKPITWDELIEMVKARCVAEPRQPDIIKSLANLSPVAYEDNLNGIFGPVTVHCFFCDTLETEEGNIEQIPHKPTCIWAIAVRLIYPPQPREPQQRTQPDSPFDARKFAAVMDAGMPSKNKDTPAPSARRFKRGDKVLYKGGEYTYRGHTWLPSFSGHPIEMVELHDDAVGPLTIPIKDENELEPVPVLPICDDCSKGIHSHHGQDGCRQDCACAYIPTEPEGENVPSAEAVDLDAAAFELYAHALGLQQAGTLELRARTSDVKAVLLRVAKAAVEQAQRERDLAIAHDRQPYPTAQAYNAVCIRLEQFRSAIKDHRDQYSDDRCWMDDQKLYRVLGDGDLGDNHIGDKRAMLENCKRFLDQRCAEGGPWATYAELEAALTLSLQLQSHYADLLNMRDGGERRQFKTPAEWLARIKELSLLNSELGE